MLVGNLYTDLSEFKDTIIVRPLISEAPMLLIVFL